MSTLNAYIPTPQEIADEIEKEAVIIVKPKFSDHSPPLSELIQRARDKAKERHYAAKRQTEKGPEFPEGFQGQGAIERGR